MTLTGVRQGRTPTTAFIPKFQTLAVKAKITNDAVLAALFNTMAGCGGGEQRSYQNTGRGSGRLDEPMDIDAMAPKERQCHQELGLCFYCHKQGHLFHQCPERDKKCKENPKRHQPSGPAYVRGLFKDLPIEDRAALFEQLSEDF
ncbi:hypothetical protein DAEQUDRAFT_768512 [Daedalea quercina L-15889]|uniref:CCHC-type domain-containing protein n=1 Tax=Daedalea quercina L-15889 TaxID=1314783 RepID=A0A165MNI5_9APHY|nr:hypothetical protein DAEQUDRAFT_768512 [Daedalea quercina L-15889]